MFRTGQCLPKSGASRRKALERLQMTSAKVGRFMNIENDDSHLGCRVRRCKADAMPEGGVPAGGNGDASLVA